MEIKVLEEQVKFQDLKSFADFWYTDFLKGTVDVKNDKVAIGGEWHIESLEELVKTGGHKDDIWGFNILFPEGKIEYHSMVNIKPNKNHKDMIIIEEDLIEEINKVIYKFISF